MNKNRYAVILEFTSINVFLITMVSLKAWLKINL